MLSCAQFQDSTVKNYTEVTLVKTKMESGNSKDSPWDRNVFVFVESQGAD